MTKIKLIEDAYYGGYEKRLRLEDGSDSIYVLTDFYEAKAEDEEGNEYLVFWKITDPDAEEDVICDWDNPTYIESEYRNVTNKVTL